MPDNQTPSQKPGAVPVGTGELVGRLRVECSARYVICPHCGASYQPESEDFSENERDEECFTCKRTYQVWQSFEVYHHAAYRESRDEGRAGNKPSKHSDT